MDFLSPFMAISGCIGPLIVIGIFVVFCVLIASAFQRRGAGRYRRPSMMSDEIYMHQRFEEPHHHHEHHHHHDHHHQSGGFGGGGFGHESGGHHHGGFSDGGFGGGHHGH